MEKLNISEFLEGNCFVYIQGNEADIEKYYELVKLSKDDKLILYPERGMTYTDTVCYRPYVKSVITENPWIIGCYSIGQVWVIQDGEWVHPSQQTYGASINSISIEILGNYNTIPLMILGGIKEINDYRKKIKINKF
jgi:hypothetical protein